jgi:hypothetical protein
MTTGDDFVQTLSADDRTRLLAALDAIEQELRQTRAIAATTGDLDDTGAHLAEAMQHVLVAGDVLRDAAAAAEQEVDA